MLSYDVIEWGKSLQQRIRETPTPQGTEVLVKLKYCGVCHSDVHIREGYIDMGGSKRFLLSERGMFPPVTLGHEPFGTVVAAGPQAQNVPIGQDRLVYPWTGCGHCARCQDGCDNHCMAQRYLGVTLPGSYADHLLIPHPRYLIDASGIDPAWAATLSCSGLTSYAAVRQLDEIPSEEWVAVIGAGGLGLQAINILRALGHDRVLAIDVDDNKLIAAKDAGATGCINSTHSDALERIRKLTGGTIYGAIDLVGSTQTATLALSLLRKASRLIFVGLWGGEIMLSTTLMAQKGYVLRGTSVGSIAELKEVVALAQAGKLKPIPIEQRPLSDVSKTLDELKDGKITGRVVLRIE